MSSFLKRYRDPLLIALLLLGPLISFLSTGHKGREPNFVDRGILWVAAPIQGALTWVVNGVGGAGSGYVALRGAHEEAKQCRASVAELTAELNALKEVKAENQRLHAMLNYAEATPQQEVMARVIGVNPSPQFQSLRIDRGERDGLRPGMPVMTPDGVVGQVVRVVGNSSDVMVLTDPSSSIAGVLQRTRARATVTGTGDLRRLTLDFVRREDDAAPGDIIVTAGTDGIFPRGLPLGRVASVQRPNVGLFLLGQVTPAVDVRKVEEVLVIPISSGLAEAHLGAAPP